MSDNRKQN